VGSCRAIREGVGALVSVWVSELRLRVLRSSRSVAMVLSISVYIDFKVTSSVNRPGSGV